MKLLGPLWAMLAMLHCVYAEYQPISLYNPLNGQEMDPIYFQTRHMRSSRETHVSDNVIQLPSMGIPCSCQDFSCTCCVGIRLGGNQNFCVKVLYEWRIFGVRFFVEYNDRLLTTFGFSAQNVPDYCSSLFLPLPIFSCLRLSNVEIVDTDNSLNLCVSFVFKVIFSQIFEYKFGCMRLGATGVHIITNPNRIGLENDKQEILQADELNIQPTNDNIFS